MKFDEQGPSTHLLQGIIEKMLEGKNKVEVIGKESMEGRRHLEVTGLPPTRARMETPVTEESGRVSGIFRSPAPVFVLRLR